MQITQTKPENFRLYLERHFDDAHGGHAQVENILSGGHIVGAADAVKWIKEAGK